MTMSANSLNDSASVVTRWVAGSGDSPRVRQGGNATQGNGVRADPVIGDSRTGVHVAQAVQALVKLK